MKPKTETLDPELRKRVTDTLVKIGLPELVATAQTLKASPEDEAIWQGLIDILTEAP